MLPEVEAAPAVTEPAPVSTPGPVAFERTATPAAEPEPDQAYEEGEHPPTGPVLIVPRPKDRAARHRARHARQTLTFLVLVLLVFGAGGVAWARYQGLVSWWTHAETSSVPCPTPSPIALPIKETQVNVFNATDRRGLAAGVGATLRKRGFDLGVTGNDSEGEVVRDAATIRFGDGGLLAARTVAAQINGKVKLTQVEGRTGPDVDLVLGPGYRTLRTPAQAAKLTTPKPIKGPQGCVPATG